MSQIYDITFHSVAKRSRRSPSLVSGKPHSPKRHKTMNPQFDSEDRKRIEDLFESVLDECGVDYKHHDEGGVDFPLQDLETVDALAQQIRDQLGIRFLQSTKPVAMIKVITLEQFLEMLAKEATQDQGPYSPTSRKRDLSSHSRS